MPVTSNHAQPSVTILDDWRANSALDDMLDTVFNSVDQGNDEQPQPTVVYETSDNTDAAALDQLLKEDHPRVVVSSVIDPRPYQLRIREKVVGFAEDGLSSALVSAATGAGKTVTAFLVAAELVRRGYITRRIGFTCFRVGLVAQARAECAAKFPELLDRTIFFSSFTSTPPTDIDLLIEDEAQHSASSTATTIVEAVMPKFHLGLTATPMRTDRIKLAFARVVQDAGIKSLMMQGYLSQYHLYNYDRRWEPREVVSTYLADPDRWGKSVMFFSNLDDAYDAAARLRASGVRASAVRGGEPKVTEQTLRAFRHGELDVLTNVVVLTEGFDEPELRTVFVRPGTKLPVIQMCGRVLRKHPDKPFAQVVQPVASPYSFTKLVKPAEIFATTANRAGWEPQSYNERLATDMIARMTIGMADAPVAVLPKSILAKLATKPGWGRRAANLRPQPAADVPPADDVAPAPAPPVEPEAPLAAEQLNDIRLFVDGFDNTPGSAFIGDHTFIGRGAVAGIFGAPQHIPDPEEQAVDAPAALG